MTAYAPISIATYWSSSRARRAGYKSALLTAMILLTCTLLLSLHQFGDPIIGLDEQFYLLVGDRLWRGAIPYIDIWDRKPAGLFLLYAAIRALPGDGILAYQIVASLCLAATAMIVAAIARRAVPFTAALAAGLAVILYTVLLGDGFGEAPIYYDLLTASAAWCVLRTRDAPVQRHARWLPGAAMLLCGLAITIKTVAIFEGCAMGVMLLATHRVAGMRWRRIIWRACGYAVLGAAPMLAIAAFYAMRGEFAAFWFANVVSVGLRSGAITAQTVIRPLGLLILLSPLVVLALAGSRGSTGARDRTLLLAWLGTTVAGYLAVGFFFFHYAIPLLAPLAILAAAALRERRWLSCAALALMGAAILWCALGSGTVTREHRRQVAALLAALPRDVPTRCLLVAEGPAILYHLSHACLASPYAFPGHIAAFEEADALGQSRAAILRAVFARHPAAIVTKGYPADPLLAAGLAHNYRPSAPLPTHLFGDTQVNLIVWRRRA